MLIITFDKNNERLRSGTSLTWVSRYRNVWRISTRSLRESCKSEPDFFHFCMNHIPAIQKKYFSYVPWGLGDHTKHLFCYSGLQLDGTVTVCHPSHRMKFLSRHESYKYLSDSIWWWVRVRTHHWCTLRWTWILCSMNNGMNISFGEKIVISKFIKIDSQ